MTSKSEIDALLGSESESEGDNFAVKEAPKKVFEKKSNVDDLLGLSDDEPDLEDDDGDLKEEDQHDEEGEGEEADEFDDLFGKKNESESNRSKKKTNSSLEMPPAFKIPSAAESIFLRTPNFLKIQTKEYDPYDDELFSKEREMFAGATSVIRHRSNPSTRARESNAQLIKWDDGTYQLVVGDATFNVKVVPTDNCFVYEQQSSIQTSTVKPLKKSVSIEGEGGEQNTDTDMQTEEEVVKSRAVTCMECNGTIQARMTIQPSSLDSEIHARMSLMISEKFKKEKKISVRDYEKISENPEKTLNKLAKEEEDRMKKEQRAKSQDTPATKRAWAQGIRRPGMSADYLQEEEEGEYDTYNANARKQPKAKKNGRKKKADDDEEGEGESLGGEDSYDEEEEEDGMNEYDEGDGFIAKEEEEEDEDMDADFDGAAEEKKKKKKKSSSDKKEKEKKSSKQSSSSSKKEKKRPGSKKRSASKVEEEDDEEEEEAEAEDEKDEEEAANEEEFVEEEEEKTKAKVEVTQPRKKPRGMLDSDEDE